MKFFDLSSPIQKKGNSKNVTLLYFSSHDQASNYISSSLKQGVTVLGYTPSNRNIDSHDYYYTKSLKKPHAIIGQEFDHVAVIINEHFSYSNKKLVYNGSSYYDAPKMLFQNITRTRKKLTLLIINNKNVFNECLSIMNCILINYIFIL